ncbi:MAG: multidrug transporter, partial [Chitinophagaceae bacterium]|nr:multidrug transporter [Chitinophagaceae bacterium]
MKYILLLLLSLIKFNNMSAAQEKPGQQKFLIHVTTGQDNPTKAALSFLV